MHLIKFPTRVIPQRDLGVILNNQANFFNQLKVLLGGQLLDTTLSVLNVKLKLIDGFTQ